MSKPVKEILSLANESDYHNKEAKQNLATKYKNEVDAIVYKLYDLTYSEVKIIDPEFTLSEEEYDNYQI